MSLKFSVAQIAKRNFETYIDNETGKVKPTDVFWFAIAPAACGVAIGLLGVSLTDNGASMIVAGVSTLSALMCAMAVMLFQLRVQVTNSCDSFVTKPDKGLLDQTFFNILWSIVIGLTIVVALIILDAAGWFSAFGELPARGAIGCVVALGMHFLLTVFMAIKRLARAYYVIGMHRH